MAPPAGKKEEEEEKTEAPPPKKSKKKLFILIGAIVGVVVLIGVPVVFFTLKGRHAPSDPSTVAVDTGSEPGALVPEGKGEEDELGDNEEALGGIAPLDTFVVNLKGGRFLRVQMQFEFTDRDIPIRFIQRGVVIRDSIVTLLTNKKADEIFLPEGKNTLKRELRDLVNELVHKEIVKNVYFTQFVVQ